MLKIVVTKRVAVLAEPTGKVGVLMITRYFKYKKLPNASFP